MRWLAKITRNSLAQRSELLVQRLLSSPAIQEAGQMLSTPFGDASEVSFAALIEALSKAEMGERIAAAEPGQGVQLQRTPDGVLLHLEGGEVLAAPQLGILDPAAEIRLAEFERVLLESLPTIPNEGSWRVTFGAHVPSPREFSAFVKDVRLAPGPALESLTEAFVKRSVASNLIPRGKGYYEAIVGAMPSQGSATGYLREVFYPHLRAVYERSPDWAWRLAVAGYTGPSVDLNEVFARADSEQLLSLVQEGKEGSPIAPVAVLSVALARAATDERFLELAKSAMAALSNAVCPNVEANTLAVIFRSLALLALRAISQDEETWSAPAFWRRTAAMAHAHLLLQYMDFRNADASKFGQWLDSTPYWAGTVAIELDAWTEPSWQPDRDYLFTPSHSAVAHAIRLCLASPVGDAVYNEERIAELNETPGLDVFARFWGSMPELISAAKRPGNQPEELLDETVVSFLIEQVPTASDAHQRWLTLLSNARIKRFPTSLVTAVCEWAGAIPKLAGGSDLATQVLHAAARIAAVQGSREVAEAVARAVIEVSPSFGSAKHAGLAWSALVTAAAAVQEVTDRIDWLEPLLLELAFTLPRGVACGELAARIRAMQQLQPVTSRRYGRARAMAASASVV